MVDIETNIEAALKQRLGTLSLTPTLLVAWDNEDFNPPAGQRYIIPQLSRNNTSRPFVPSESSHRHFGVFLLSLMCPLGQQAIDSTKVADQIAAHFPCDLRVEMNGVSVRIEKKPGIEGGYKDGTRWRIPIIIEYECWA